MGFFESIKKFEKVPVSWSRNGTVMESTLWNPKRVELSLLVLAFLRTPDPAGQGFESGFAFIREFVLV